MVPEPGRAPQRQDPGAGQGPPRQSPHRDARGQAARLADHDGPVARLRPVPGGDEARHSSCAAESSLNLPPGQRLGLMTRRALLAVLALLAACTLNPVSGRPELTVLSAAEERRIGAEQAAKVARTIGLVDDPGLTTYVQEVGRRLAAQSPRRDVTYTFAVIDMAAPNAFSPPGG